MVNSRDSIDWPSTFVIACTDVPGASPVKVARPLSSVVACHVWPPPWSSTGWFARLFDMSPRTTRTETVPVGTSLVGSGTPDICDTSGIWAKTIDAQKSALARVYGKVRRTNVVLGVGMTFKNCNLQAVDAGAAVVVRRK
jgi:hypothetical protein